MTNNSPHEIVREALAEILTLKGFHVEKRNANPIDGVIAAKKWGFRSRNEFVLEAVKMG